MTEEQLNELKILLNMRLRITEKDLEFYTNQGGVFMEEYVKGKIQAYKDALGDIEEVMGASEGEL